MFSTAQQLGGLIANWLDERGALRAKFGVIDEIEIHSDKFYLQIVHDDGPIGVGMWLYVEDPNEEDFDMYPPADHWFDPYDPTFFEQLEKYL